MKVLLAVLLLVGCGVPEPLSPTPSEQPSPASSTLVLDYRLEVQRAPEQEATVARREHEPFVSGSRFRFALEVQQSGFLYVVAQGSDGSFSVLWPQADEGGDPVWLVQMQPNRVPPAENTWFELDDKVGEERLYLLFSLWPVRELERLLLAPEPDTAALDAAVRQLREVQAFSGAARREPTETGVRVSLESKEQRPVLVVPIHLRHADR